MTPLDPGQRSEVAKKLASRMRYPQLFVVVAVLFLVDLFFPDAIPFVDEILLAFLAVLLGTWKERRKAAAPPDQLPPAS